MIDLTPLVKCVNSHNIGIYENVNVSNNLVDEDDDEIDRVERFRRENESLLSKRFRGMAEALADVLTDFGLISFLPMNIEDGEVL